MAAGILPPGVPSASTCQGGSGTGENPQKHLQNCNKLNWHARSHTFPDIPIRLLSWRMSCVNVNSAGRRGMECGHSSWNLWLNGSASAALSSTLSAAAKDMSPSAACSTNTTEQKAHARISVFMAAIEGMLPVAQDPAQDAC